MADGYTPVYDTEDITEGSIDFFAVFIISLVGLAALVGLVLIGTWGYGKVRNFGK